MRSGRLTPLVVGLLGVLTVADARGSDVRPPEGRTFAIVVGYNGALPGEEALQFADDDALKWAALLELFADDVSLLTEVDDETASELGLHDHGSSIALPPTRTELRAAFDRYNQPGARIIYVHIAHGLRDKVERGGEGFVKMAPDPKADPRGRLYRSDLRAEIVDALHPAARLDLIIDACDAAHLVRRGANPAEQVAAALARDDLTKRPNVGVISATRGEWQVNESSELEGSYFSLVLRSALLGLADPDGLGVVRYWHLEAALKTAGRAENRPKEDFRPLVAPPAGRTGTPFVDWTVAPADTPTLRLGPEIGGRVYIRDAVHGPWASFGKAYGHVVEVRGVVGRTYYVKPARWGAGRTWTAAAGAVSYDELSQPGPFTGQARGTAARRMYRGLFHCKIFEGYAIANGWALPNCERDEPDGDGETPARLGVGYQLADAPFQRLSVSHGLTVTGELPLSARVRLVGLARGEVAHEAAAAPYETIWGAAVGAGAEVAALRAASTELGVVGLIGWAPVFLRGPTGADRDRWLDGFIEAGVVARYWWPGVAVAATAGVSLEVRPSDETTALDPRWLFRIALEVDP